MGRYSRRLAFLCGVLLAAYSASAVLAKSDKCTKSLRRILEASPESLILKIDDELPTRFFDHAVQKWSAAFPDRRLKPIVHEIASEQEISPAESSYLSQMKVKGSLLRLSFRFFSLSHSIPESWQALVKKLGQLKDFLEFRRLKTAATLAQDLEQWSMSAGHDALLKPISNFRPSTPSSIRRYIKKVIDRDAELLQQRSLTGLEFHELKKDLWMISEVVFFLHRDSPTKQQLQVFRAINKLFKKYHRPIVKQKVLDELRSRDISVELPKPLTKKLLEILSLLEIETV